MSDWQTIDTAPKDGTLIWLGVAANDKEPLTWLVVLARYDSWRKVWRYVDGADITYMWVKKWRPCPIPDPPE